MRRIRCYECGKSYDYDEDCFCPKCGAFNQPPRSIAIASDGSVVRRDGLNERNHKGSFAHEEFHEENRERKIGGPDSQPKGAGSIGEEKSHQCCGLDHFCDHCAECFEQFLLSFFVKEEAPETGVSFYMQSADRSKNEASFDSTIFPLFV